MTAGAPCGARPASAEDRVAIRPMTAGDLPAIVALERAIFPAPWRAADFGGFLSLRAGLGRVAVAEEALVGYAVGWVASDEAELANLAVAAAARRRGAGRALVEAFSAAARVRGARSLWLEVRAGDAGAQAFYRHLAFADAGRRRGYYERPREDALVMVRALDSNPAQA